MSHEESFTDRLSEYLDGELTAAERAHLDAHLNECVRCRATLDELRAVVARAASLEDTGPARDLWAGVAERIDDARQAAPVVVRGAFGSAIRKRISFTLPQLAAAALALMVLTGGLVWRARSGDPRADFQPVNASTSSSASDEADVARVLDGHLRAIDEAIAECTRAAADNPGETYLAAHLARLKSQRVTLLRETADQHSAER